MSASQKPEPGTSIALADAAVGTLPVEIRQRLELHKLQNQVAGELAKMNWGKSLDLVTRRAIADWGRTYKVDVTTEIDVLGANIYLNARYYLRRLAELIDRGVVEYALADHIEDDPRLAKLGAEGEGEATRRLRERVKYAVPDAAKGAVVFRIKLRHMAHEMVGVNWCGGGSRKSDPVGDAEPGKTAESRAARRAIRMLATHVPGVAEDVETVVREAEQVTARIATAHREFAASEAEAHRILPARGTPGGALQGLDGYGEEVTPPSSIAHTLARQPDPYTVPADGSPRVPTPEPEPDEMALDDRRFGEP